VRVWRVLRTARATGPPGPAGGLGLDRSLRGPCCPVLGTNRLHVSDDPRLQVEGSSREVVVAAGRGGRLCDADPDMLGSGPEMVCRPPRSRLAAAGAGPGSTAVRSTRSERGLLGSRREALTPVGFHGASLIAEQERNHRLTLCIKMRPCYHTKLGSYVSQRVESPKGLGAVFRSPYGRGETRPRKSVRGFG
jgi:hypothetical protein